MRIWIRNTVFFLANLWICSLRTGTPKKFADMRFADNSLQICGFAICPPLLICVVFSRPGPEVGAVPEVCRKPKRRGEPQHATRGIRFRCATRTGESLKQNLHANDSMILIN
jgi:hypothetical protein